MAVPGLDGGETYFQGGRYPWMDKDGYHREVTSLRGILSECGFNSIGSGSWKKAPCVIFMNLLVPCPAWQGSAGKTGLDLTPYQRLIATTVSSLAYKMPSIRTNPGASHSGGGIGWPTAGECGEYVGYLKDFLKERKSDVWYRIRPKLIADHFTPRKGEFGWAAARKGLTSAISNTNEELWPNGNITREGLGIIARARAVMYFKGQTYLITSDNIDELASIGTTDLVIVEKEGITDVLIKHAAKYSIALVATAGKLVTYAKILIKSAYNNGINVSTL